MPKTPIKRLFFDIETTPNIGLFWESGYQITVTPESIVKERSVICIGYKWAHERKVHAVVWDKNQCDKQMIKEFIPILDQADEIVAHNGIDFDVKWLRTRALKHKIPVVPDYTVLDTLKIARSRFKFNSNKLDYISQYLGLGQKKPTTYDLWKKVLLENDKKSLKTMVSYCKQDVLLLESVWDRMNSYVLAKTSAAGYTDWCPECNSHNTKIRKRRVTASGYRKVQFQCNDCGKYGTVAESRWLKHKEI